MARMSGIGIWMPCVKTSRSSNRISSFFPAVSARISHLVNRMHHRSEISDAASSAQADEFIDAFPDKYDTIIGERGVTLSGGQRQRLALARAFLTDPRILILDDSTSAIDSATEDRIQKAIFAAAHGRTAFIITHRLSQIRWADIILVLNKGRIVGMGNHEELMKNSKAYRDLFND